MKPVPQRPCHKIQIPHLNYTVSVKPRSAFKSPNPGFALTENIDRHNAIIYIDNPKNYPCTVAHEVIHVLGFICETKGIVFENEREHMGYLMQYLMGQILGYEYER